MICYCIGQKIDLNRRNNEQGHKIIRERRAESDPEIEKGKQGHKIIRERRAKSDPEIEKDKQGHKIR